MFYIIIRIHEDGFMQCYHDVFVDLIDAQKEAYSLTQASMNEETGYIENYYVYEVSSV